MENNQKKKQRNASPPGATGPGTPGVHGSLLDPRNETTRHASVGMRSNGSFSPFSSGSIAFQLPRQ
jgi:hypothetical protein